jgi:hypothetical protein
MPTRRIFELMLITNMMFWPARATVHKWGQLQMQTNMPGSVRHGVGEVITTII